MARFERKWWRIEEEEEDYVGGMKAGGEIRFAKRIRWKREKENKVWAPMPSPFPKQFNNNNDTLYI